MSQRRYRRRNCGERARTYLSEDRGSRGAREAMRSGWQGWGTCAQERSVGTATPTGRTAREASGGRVGARKGDCRAARLTHGSDGGERRWRASPKEDGGGRRRRSCGTGVGEHSNEPWTGSFLRDRMGRREGGEGAGDGADRRRTGTARSSSAVDGGREGNPRGRRGGPHGSQPRRCGRCFAKGAAG